jgi:hypothetical protein
MLPSAPRPPIAQLQPKGSSCCNIPFLLISLFFALAAPVSAQQQFVTDEDRSRFVERFYNKAEPGLRSPAEYIEIAKKAAHSQYESIPLSNFSDGMVTYRKYRNAPKADQEIIAVAFVYQGKYSGGGLYGPNLLFTRADPERPILLVQMRRDLSKIYVNVIHFKAK